MEYMISKQGKSTLKVCMEYVTSERGKYTMNIYM